MSGVTTLSQGLATSCLGRTWYHGRVCKLLGIMFPRLTHLIRLLDILKHNPGPQMSYQVAFCLWLLSFEQNVADELNKSVQPTSPP